MEPRGQTASQLCSLSRLLSCCEPHPKPGPQRQKGEEAALRPTPQLMAQAMAIASPVTKMPRAEGMTGCQKQTDHSASSLQQGLESRTSVPGRAHTLQQQSVTHKGCPARSAFPLYIHAHTLTHTHIQGLQNIHGKYTSWKKYAIISNIFRNKLIF